MPTIQELIKQAQEAGSKEEKRKFNLKVEVSTYGKADQCWKVVKRVIQECRLQGLDVKFFLLNGEEITDTSDGSTEYVDAPYPEHPPRLPSTGSDYIFEQPPNLIDGYGDKNG